MPMDMDATKAGAACSLSTSREPTAPFTTITAGRRGYVSWDLGVSLTPMLKAPTNKRALATPTNALTLGPRTNCWGCWSPGPSNTSRCRSRSENPSEGRIGGRFRTTRRDRRTEASCRAQTEHARKCSWIAATSNPGCVSSKYAKCFFLKDRQSIVAAGGRGTPFQTPFGTRGGFVGSGWHTAPIRQGSEPSPERAKRPCREYRARPLKLRASRPATTRDAAQ